MATKIINKENAALYGLSKYNEAMYGFGHLKAVVVEVDDMSQVADNDIVYTFPDDAVLIATLVKNIGSTAFSVATTLYIDDGTTNQTANINTLAANTSSYTYVQPARKAAGSQLLWAVTGANSSASTAKARIVILFATFENVNI